MKIKYFRLKNYAGIKYGINNSVFELKDIPDGIIKLTGDNGCGKSTTLHSLHIFSDDKSFLIKNEDDTYEPAEKELIVEHNGIEYHIVHQYNNKGSKKSFISKNGEELNGNGNVTTFEDKVKEELGIINNSISNFVIGVSEVNFIEMSASERKKEIASLLPNISSYEKLYKNTTDNLNGYKKQVSIISKLIADTGSIDEIDNKILEINEKIKPIVSEIENLNNTNLDNGNKKAVYESKKTELETSLNELKTLLESKQDGYNKAMSIIEKFDVPPKELDMMVLNGKKDVAINNLNNLTNEKNSIMNEISIKNEKWSNFVKIENNNRNIVESQNKLKEQIKNVEIELNDYNKELESLLSINSKPYFREDILNNITSVGMSIKEELTVLSNSYTHSIDEKTELELYMEIDSIREKVNLYRTKQDEYNKLCSIIDMLEGLNKAANNVAGSNLTMSEGCSFEKCSRQYSGLLQSYKEKRDQLGQMLEKNLEKFNQYLQFISIDDKYKFVYPSRIELANSLELTEDYASKARLNDFIQILREKKKEIDEYFFNVNKIPEKKSFIENKNQLLNQLNANLNSMQLIDNPPLDFTEEDIKNLQVLVDEKSKEIVNANQKVHSITKEIESLIEYQSMEKAKAFIETFNTKKEELNNITNSFTDNANNLKTIQDNIMQINSLIKSKNDILLEFNKSIKELEDKKLIINEHISNKAKLDGEIEDISYIVNALHPTKGIPSLLVKTYLERIEYICNDILETTFDSSYKIYLENLEKDFFVRVYEKSTNRYIEDVKLASSGQQAIIKLVLSIALTKCSVGDALYLRLDEIDSVWDAANIMALESLLNGLHSKYGIEQMFLVSHNSAVSVSDMLVEFDRAEQEYKIKRLS